MHWFAKFILSLACIASLNSSNVFSQDSVDTKELGEIARLIGSLSGDNAESILDREVAKLNRQYKETKDEMILEVLFNAGCKYQFANKDKAKLIFKHIISSTENYALKSTSSYQLGYSDFGEPQAAINFELAIKYLAEVDDEDPYSSLLGNCYGHAAAIYANNKQFEQAQRVYSEFFSHGDLAHNIDPHLAIAYATSLTKLNDSLRLEPDKDLASVVVKIISNASEKESTKTLRKSIKPAIRLLYLLLKRDADFDEITELANAIERLIQKTGDDKLLLGFLVEWQLIEFFGGINDGEMEMKYAKGVAQSSDEILRILIEMDTPSLSSVLEKSSLEAETNHRIRTQALLVDAIGKKFTSGNGAVAPFRKVRELLAENTDPKWRFQPVVANFGQSKGWHNILSNACNLVRNGEDEKIQLNTILELTESRHRQSSSDPMWKRVGSPSIPTPADPTDSP